MTEAPPDRADIERRQLALLRKMIAEVQGRNPFYTRKWEGTGLSPDVRDLPAFFALAPFTLKHELVDDQLADPPYGTNLTYPFDCYTRFCQTSGTAGEPMRWLDTSESWSWMVENWVTVFRESGVSRGDRIFYAFSFGPFLGFWTAFDAGARLGCLCLPGGGMSSLARLRAILDNEVTALCCTPTYALRLGEAAAEAGIDLTEGHVRTIIVAGEAGGAIPATRARIEAAWPGARVKDHHGMTEVGPVSYECPERPGVLHVMEDGYIAEVVDASGRGRGAGERGELVLTNLGRWGSPLVRYRTGDVVQRAAQTPCACGRFELGLEGGIIGRTDDMVIVRGVNLFPSAFEGILRGFPAVAEYCVEVRTAEVTVQVEPAGQCAEPDRLRNDLEAALRAAFNLRVPVVLVERGSLPRFELKAKRWIRC